VDFASLASALPTYLDARSRRGITLGRLGNLREPYTQDGDWSRVEKKQAEELLKAERARVESLLDAVKGDGQSDRSAANEQGDMSDSSETLVSEGTDDAVASGLTQRLAAIERAEQRLAAGTYGRSITSGDVIPDDRLEADPAAELTVDEAARL
jgi:DnaK suppressor protein